MMETELKKLKIGGQAIGIVGLKAVFQAMAADFSQKTDADTAAELVRRLAQQNYIPGHLREEYGRAFLNEFHKFLGRSVETKEEAARLEIKILGAGCTVCDGLENELMDILAEMGLPADLEHVREPAEIAAYKVTGTPALVINGKVMSVGPAPPRLQIKKWLQAGSHSNQSGGNMEKNVLIKNIPFSEPQNLADLVEYAEGRVVSRTFAQKPGIGLTLFAFDTGEGVSTHTAPGDAMVQVLDGEALVNIDGKEMTVGKGQVVVMPANVPHAVTAVKRFKMLLIVVK